MSHIAPPLESEAVRARFPSLRTRDSSRARTYFDNAAGSQVPQSVIAAVSDFYLRRNGNSGGFGANSVLVEALDLQAHEALADFLGSGDTGEAIVGASMTTLTLHLSRSISHTWRAGDEVIITTMDHEGNVAPWLTAAADKGVVVRRLPFNRDTWRLEPQDLADLLTPKTRLVALNYASNLTGAINDIPALTALAREAGALTFVDAVQLAPHRALDVRALGCDFLACSAYKFFGPHLGVVWGRRALLESLPAYKCRTVSETLPDKFRTGTPQYELLAALKAAIDYFAMLGGATEEASPEASPTAPSRRACIEAGFAAAAAAEDEVGRFLLEGLATIPGITLHGPPYGNEVSGRVPTFSFTHESLPPAAMAAPLAEAGFLCHNGHNYALESVRYLGLNEDHGVLRASLAHYNTRPEAEGFLEALARIVAH